MAKVLIIGAGIGGLASAARLAKSGHNVEIFEASDEIGGKCKTKWVGDYAFDIGPSLLTIPAVYRDLFMKTGMRIEHLLDLKPVDPAFSYHFADGEEIIFPNQSVKNICESIELSLGKKAGDEWHNLMQRGEKMWDVSRTPFVESELKSIGSLIRRKGFLRDLRVIAPFRSLRKLTSTYTKNPYLLKIIDRYATYSGSDPRKVPAVLLTIPFIESAFGAWHISGGLGQLPIALAKRCEELGVVFHFKSRVDSIITDGKKALGVSVNGQEISGDYVVANADAEIVYNRLISKKVRIVNSERKKLKSATKSLAGFSLLLGLDNSKITGEIPSLKHHNVYFPEDYDSEFNEIFKLKVPVNDPAIYICYPNDPKMIKRENIENWFVLVNAPCHDPKDGWDWEQDPQGYAEKLIAKLDALGLKVSERLEVMEYSTPKDLEAKVSAPGGSIYGTSSNGAKSAFLRASNSSPLENLYCVGGSAHPGGGLPLVGISAEIVSLAIARAQSKKKATK